MFQRVTNAVRSTVQSPDMIAAKYGRLDYLKTIYENGFPWSKDTIAYAAKNGHLDCLKYAHANGCPWSKDTIVYARQGGHFKCIEYIVKNLDSET